MRRLLALGGAVVLMGAAVTAWVTSGANSEALSVAADPEELDEDGLPIGDTPEGDSRMPNVPGAPKADPKTREQKRFGRYDKDKDGAITRDEMMGSRVTAFKKLDKNGDKFLSFEEWASATGDRFAKADADKSKSLTPAEFATTAPKRKAKPACRC